MIDNAIFCIHLTTGRPLPQDQILHHHKQAKFDALNSPKPIVLAPVEKPNIPPSIDTLDEQKTDKKPKDKKRRRRKRKTKSRINQLMYRTIMY